MTNISGRSFIATLVCVTEKQSGAVDFTRTPDIGGDGWLTQGAQAEEVFKLRFDFIEHIGERLHYRITADADAGMHAHARLGVSRNGYLGLYKEAEVTDPWKIEMLEHEAKADYFECYLRDARGYRAGVINERRGNFITGIDSRWNEFIDFLNVRLGRVARFQVTIVEYV